MRKNHLFKFILILICLSSLCKLNAQNTTINMFGHINAFGISKEDNFNAYMELGEHDLFVRSNFTNKISFLGEYIVKPTADGFSASIERSWIKYSYYRNHNLSVGKVHTPVNYWNDSYHHGRVFFPTIDRPMAFKHLVPIHTLGFRLQGQNLGKLNFGYDLMIGNGMESTDFFAEGLSPSYTLALHIKPIYGLQIRASYYYEFINNVNNMGSHAGHHQSHVGFHNHNPYTGFVEYNLWSMSVGYFGGKFELLGEFSYNTTRTDTLGTAHNVSSFLYCGIPLNEMCIPFFTVDFINIGNKDLHSLPYNAFRTSIGYRHEFNELVNLKIMLEHVTSFELMSDYGESDVLAFKIQVAYGI